MGEEKREREKAIDILNSINIEDVEIQPGDETEKEYSIFNTHRDNPEVQNLMLVGRKYTEADSIVYSDKDDMHYLCKYIEERNIIQKYHIIKAKIDTASLSITIVSVDNAGVLAEPQTFDLESLVGDETFLIGDFDESTIAVDEQQIIFEEVSTKMKIVLHVHNEESPNCIIRLRKGDIT